MIVVISLVKVGLLVLVRAIAPGTERVDITVRVVALVVVAEAHEVVAHGELGERGWWFGSALETLKGI